jgi:hypothetical protein
LPNGSKRTTNDKSPSRLPNLMPPKKKKKKKDKDHSDASPAKSLGEALSALRRNLRQALRSYETKLAGDLEAVIAWNTALAENGKPTREQLRDIGDMLGLIRKLKVKPEKGRRRDLRKLDTVVEDLVLLSHQKRAA